MDKDNMKETWEYYGEKLDRSLMLNEELLRLMTLDRSRKQLGGIYGSEISSTIAGILILLYCVHFAIRYSHDTRLMVCALIVAGLAIMASVLGIKNMRMLSRIEFYKLPVVSLQKELADYERFYYKQKKILFLMMPVMFMAFFPVLNMDMNGFDLFKYSRIWKDIIPVVLVGLILTYALVIWIYRTFYERKIRNIKELLGQLEYFEKPAANETVL